MTFSILEHCVDFDWDNNNQYKNFIKHNVIPWECEQIFFNKPLLGICTP